MLKAELPHQSFVLSFFFLLLSHHWACLFTAASLSKSRKLSDKATIPTQGSEFATDLSSINPAWSFLPVVTLVKTDLTIACPAGTYAHVPRSGLALKKGIDTAGVIVPTTVDLWGNSLLIGR
jgi:hypothetical protein